jgi:hypothetical protein
MVVGGFAMLLEGLKLVFTNWRLTLIQLLPAMWIWAAMMNFKAHVFHGRTFHPLYGWVLLAAILIVAGITAASFFLNAVFAFAMPDRVDRRFDRASGGPPRMSLPWWAADSSSD